MKMLLPRGTLLAAFAVAFAVLTKIRIPSTVALLLGFILFVSADQLAAGPRGPQGEHTDQQLIIHTAALFGGALICLFAAAEVLHSLRKRPPDDLQPSDGGK